VSLGPPFDDSGTRLQLGTGAAVGAVLLFVIMFGLLAAERPLGDSINFHVHVARAGALHTGAPLRVAGEQIGEVVAIRGRGQRGGAAADATQQAVDIEVRLQKAYRDRVSQNSTIVTVNPTLLTEALLEVGPPLHGAAPLAPVQDGEHLRGVDPADIDAFMMKLYLSIESILREARDLRPEWQEFQASVGHLSGELGRTMPRNELVRLSLHAAAATLAASHLAGKLRSAGVDAAPADLRELLQTAQPLYAEVARASAQLQLLNDRASAIMDAVAPRRAELSRALSDLQKAAELTGRAGKDARSLYDGFSAGRGTLGAFNADIQIFDELKEISRILKRRTWRVIIKRPDPGQRNLR
jgi:ABC-type transporter Mla subunit MlaD